ncbi:hypothetical protein B0E45_05455 [Sinorhizobium sp. A49]|jgi:hypothetical protein|nr:hypothetical protein B0E45_05455 [Sinorhizobium sp. A49]
MLAIALASDRTYLLQQHCSAFLAGDRPDAAPARIATLSPIAGIASERRTEDESNDADWTVRI